MRSLTYLEPIDYLVIGHITCDLTPNGPQIGGTASFASLTARALGLRVGVITSWAGEISLGPLESIPIINFPTEHSTTFENIYTSNGRLQVIHHVASTLDFYQVPETWRHAPIVHLGPVAQEVEPGIVRYFPNSLIGITPQGWLRTWDQDGRVHPCEWPEENFLLNQVGAAIISPEDVGGDENRIEEMAAYGRVLVVTEAAHGARVYWNGDVRRIHSPQVVEVDTTGAGDIFAAAFFYRLYNTRDPWESARFGNQLAAFSVTRPRLEAIPTPEEIRESMIEVF
jgi:hypothetical protein